MRIAWEEWHRAIPEYRLADDADVGSHGGGVMGVHRLPLVWST